MVGVNSSNNSGPNNNPENSQAIYPERLGREDDQIPSTQFKRHFPVSLNDTFQNAIRLSENSVRRGIEHFHKLMDKALAIGDKLNLLDKDTSILLRSIKTLSNSTEEFFNQMPSVLSRAISDIKKEGIQHFIESTPVENVLTALVCQVAHQSDSITINNNIIIQNVDIPVLQEFLIHSQLLFNGMIDAKIGENNYHALTLDKDIIKLSKERNKFLEGGMKPDNPKIKSIDKVIQKLEEEIAKYDSERHDLEEHRMRVFSVESQVERAKILGEKLGELLKTRVTVSVAQKFGLISNLHALCIESIWDPNTRIRETESLGNRLKTIDERLSYLFPVPFEPPHTENETPEVTAQLNDIHNERERTITARIEYENELWALNDYRKIYRQISLDIGYKELPSIDRIFPQNISLEKAVSK